VDQAALEDCLLNALAKADKGMTVGELESQCKAEQRAAAESGKEGGVVAGRLSTDESNILKPFTLMAHRPNYILLAAYNDDPNLDPYIEAFPGRDVSLEDVESQFQVSIKFPVAVDLFDSKIDIFGAYTVKSFWQVYNSDQSAPFRETNHEPEAWVQMRNDWSIFGFKNSVNMFGFVHQSNGRNEPLSKSWNRIFANFIFERGNFALSIKPWYRIEEDADDDNNPDITDYLGHGEIRAAYKWNDHVFSLMSRNNLESGFSEGAVELTWSFPLFGYKYFKGYVLGFSGYGQSLVDYNTHHNSIGVGFAFTDWL
jgi:phospholipase A1